jgi:two-component system sensor histidine kinase and response regulator WspE
MSSEAGQPDASLIDLFRSEVETHSELLSSALLALERSPGDMSRIDEMMRAAHSIKGASRVVGVDPAVRVAHVMEDCFVAAQKGTIGFSPEDVDILLRGVDLLERISATTRDPNANLALEFNDLVHALVGDLQAVLIGKGKSAGASTAGDWTAIAALAAAAAPKSEPAAPRAPTVASPTSSDVTILFPEVLNSAAAEEIRRQLLSAIDRQCATIWFDMQATRDLDVQGLAFLAAVPQHLAEHSRSSLQLAGVSIEMATVLRVTGLGESFGIRLGAAPGAE